MLYNLLEAADAKVHLPKITAHCDIPCKIYDPISAQIAALSVVRLLDIMAETFDAGDGGLEANNTITRCIFRKEEEAEKVKHEVRIIWGDYFKQPQFEAFNGTHDLVHQIMLTASACKQGVERSSGEKLVDQVNLFAEVFWRSKEIQTVSRQCPYPPNLPTVYPLFD